MDCFFSTDVLFLCAWCAWEQSLFFFSGRRILCPNLLEQRTVCAYYCHPILLPESDWKVRLRHSWLAIIVVIAYTVYRLIVLEGIGGAVGMARHLWWELSRIPISGLDLEVNCYLFLYFCSDCNNYSATADKHHFSTGWISCYFHSDHTYNWRRFQWCFLKVVIYGELVICGAIGLANE